MKKIYSLLAALTIIATTWSQVPEKMSYQAVIRNSANELVINQEVGMKISILQGSANGASVYIETRTPTTNANGLVSIELGGEDATVVSGSFSAIDWADGPYFLKTETDPSGGISYTITGTCQLLSVPYAMHSRSSEILTGVITEDQIRDLKNYLTNETDPLFSEWDKSSGITVSESQISDLQNYISEENDPVFNAWDKSSGIEISESQITDLQKYLTQETDPVFAASPVSGITAADVSNWNTAFGWGNHANEDYLISETDPVFDSSPAAGIEANHITNWNAAHGWGDHSTQGYLKSFNETDPTWSGDANQSGNIGRGGNVGIGTTSPTQKLDVNGQVRIRGGSPAAGKVLTSDANGLAAWEVLGSLPPGGTAGGDLTGTYPNPTVARIRGRNISTTVPTSGQVLKWDGSNWTPQADGFSLPFSRETSSGTYGISIGHTADYGTTYGGWFENSSTSGTGLHGVATATSGTSFGVHGSSRSTSGRGVSGYASAGSGITFGVYGSSNSTSGHGVFGYATAESGFNFGIYGRSHSTSGYGLYGLASATSGINYGVYGHTNSSSGYAGYFSGRVHITGNLSKGGGSFEIDHPLDPANKVLRHSFMESPDMMNVYNGNVTLDSDGTAWVDLPSYFEVLNKDLRYQLTPIGNPGPNLYIAQEVYNNRFQISGGTPGLRVSWQVTGVRKDRWAEENRIIVEEYKKPELRGYYLHPQPYGHPESRSIHQGENPGVVTEIK